jgi:hypothetical protein
VVPTATIVDVVGTILFQKWNNIPIYFFKLPDGILFGK